MTDAIDKPDAPPLVSLPLELAESLRDNLYDWRAAHYWWKDEPRGTYQRDYRAMTKDLEDVQAIIQRANEKGES